MDELSKEGVKAVATVLLRPLAKVIEDGVAIMGGERLREIADQRRERRRQRGAQLGQATIKLLQSRGVETVAEPTETSVDEILHAAEDENRPELQKMWVSLLAAALDPSRSSFFRHEFIAIAKKLEPLDAMVLPRLADTTPYQPTRLVYLKNVLEKSEDEVELSFRNLRALQLITENGPMVNQQQQPSPLALGRQFLRAVAP
jgi:predicted Fe-Mo cluster-binding NifX family protein